MAVLNRRNVISDHRRHDRLMIARFAAGDSFPTELDEAHALVAGCPDCAALADDIRLLSRSVGLVPMAARARDFRLTAEQADRLRGSWLDRFMRRVGAHGWRAMRPLAGVAISLGLVMTMIGSLPIAIPLGGSAAGDNLSIQAPELAPATMAGEELEPAAGPDEAPSDANSGDQPAEAFGSPPIARSLDDAYLDPTPEAGIPAGGPTIDNSKAGAFPPRELMLYAGLGMAALGFGFLVLVWLARRRITDPLLR